MREQHIFKLEDGRVKIKGVYIGLPIEKAIQMLLSQVSAMISKVI